MLQKVIVKVRFAICILIWRGVYSIWNSLPSSVTASETLGTFWRRLKTHLFAVSFSLHWTALHWFYFLTLTVYSVLEVFTRAMPASAVFAVAMCLSVRPSVRPSRWCIVSRRLKISSNFFLDPVARHSSFLIPSAITQFPGEPLQRGRKIHRRWGKFAIFDWNRRLSRKR